MVNILNNREPSINLSLDYYNYWDLFLTNSLIHPYFCDVTGTSDHIVDILFENTGQTCSLVTWDESVSNAGILTDIGLTGVDNGLVNNLTGETLNLDGNLAFCMNPISGSTYCYNLSPKSGETFSHVELNGGFYQGFYKLEGYDYQVLPTRYRNGWTVELWIKKNQLLNECTGNTNQILNDVFPQNEGFVFYLGTRAENKFCNYFSGETTVSTSDNVELTPKLDVKLTLPTNPFLFYNKSTVCGFTGNTEIYSAELSDCCDDIVDNALGVRITNEGKLNLRRITSEVVCQSGNTITNIIIENYYSVEQVISNDIWHHLVIQFSPYGVVDPCEFEKNLKGDFSIFVDTKRKLHVLNFKEIVPYSLNEHKNKQLAVPYNISIGGGTLGLLESKTFGGLDSGDGNNSKIFCIYKKTLKDCNVFNGIVLDNVEYLTESPLEYDNITSIEEFIQNTLKSNGYSFYNVEVELKNVFGIKTTIIEIQTEDQNLNIAIKLNLQIKDFPKDKCFTLKSHDGNCGILEETFAGTFIGGIYNFRMYQKKLTIQEIFCNYNLEKKIFE